MDKIKDILILSQQNQRQLDLNKNSDSKYQNHFVSDRSKKTLNNHINPNNNNSYLQQYQNQHQH